MLHLGIHIVVLGCVSLGLALVSADQASEVITAARPLWEKVATFGMLAIIVVYLLGERAYERWAERKSKKESAAAFQKARDDERKSRDDERQLDRDARHQLAGVLTDNTLATQRLSGKVGQLTDVLYLQIGGRRHTDTPPPTPKQG